MPAIAIIVLNWNQPELTLTTLKSLNQIKHPGFDYRIIIVSNTNLPVSPDIHLIVDPQNRGYAQGNNLGINYALKNKFDYILIINNDVRVDPNFLAVLVKDIQAHPRDLIAPKIYFEKGYEYFKDRYSIKDRGKVIWAMGGQVDWNNVYGSNIDIDQVDQGQFKQVTYPDFLSGCCFLATADFFRRVGTFDEKYFLYLEDVDLSVRAKFKHYRPKINPQSIIWHVNSGTAGAASKLQDYFLTRNRLLFTFKYASLRTKFAVFRESIRQLISGREWQKRGVVDFYLSNFGKGSWQ